MDFLPRGAGICTRRPLVLQLVNVPAGTQGADTATFAHKSRSPFDISKSAEDVRVEIEAETARSLGPGKAVSAEPILLTLRSPNVPNLTLVDMPGLTKIATDGQPQSIVRELEDMCVGGRGRLHHASSRARSLPGRAPTSKARTSSSWPSPPPTRTLRPRTRCGW